MMRFGVMAMAVVGFSAAAMGQNIGLSQGGAVVGTTPDVAQINTGVNLHIGGVAVSADRRYVGVNISLQSAILDGIDTYTSAGAAIPRALQPNGAAQGGPSAPVGNVQFLGTSSTLLAQKTVALRNDSMSLRAAVKKLAADTKSNVVLSANALKLAKVDEQAAHKIDLPEGTLRESIKALLEQTIPTTPMVITADSEVVYITTRAATDNQLVSKSYALEGLVVRLNRFVSKDTDLSKIKASDAPTSSQSTPLTDAITKNIRPEIWKANGGKSEVTQTGNRVVINAPASVHAMIAIPAVVVKEPERPGYVGYGSN